MSKEKPIIITITGQVGCDKSPMAKMLSGLCERLGRPCKIYDHELFTFDKHYTESRRRIMRACHDGEYDVCIVVIGSGVAKRSLDIQIAPAIPGYRLLLDLPENDE